MEDVVARIRSEYLEMPGMRLTIPQVVRLCGIEPALCRAALDALVAERFLCVKPDGRYARAADGTVFPRPRPANASAPNRARLSAA